MEVYNTDKIGNEKERNSDLDKNQIFELILDQIGGFGRFQKVLWVIGLIACFLGINNQCSTASKLDIYLHRAV